MMKKWIKAGIAAILAAALLAGCGQGTTKGELKQAGLGGLVMMYDDGIWTVNEEDATDSSLRFDAGDSAVLGVSCSKESMYQHPLDMIHMTKQICGTFEAFQEEAAPQKVEVNGEEWYEWCYSYKENGAVMKNLQRLYAKNYYAYTINYVADEKKFEELRPEAVKVMNSVVMSVPDNNEAEEKAKEFLVGEWDMGEPGYLVLKQDGTYVWYMDGSKDQANMHTGTYGCDVQNSSMGFSEGEGIYLVLFPEKLMARGEEMTTANAKYDYGITMEQQNDGSYQMLNVATFVMYRLMKQ